MNHPNIKLFLSFLLILAALPIKAQSNTNTIGLKYSIHSELMKMNRDIQVYLPSSYQESSKKYPVVYLFDGQRLFSYGVSLAQSFTNFDTGPEFIVVGINHKEGERNNDFFNKEDELLGFVERELLPFVDSNFRTNSERVAFGWQYAGSLLIKALAENPKLFSAYLVASPYPVFGERMESVNQISDERYPSDNIFYLTTSINEGVVEKGTDALEKLLEEKALKKLDWSYHKLAGESHNTTDYPTIRHGLMRYFNNYSVLQFNSHDLYLEAGGMPYVVEYFRKRAVRYGFPPEVPNWTKFTLIRDVMAINNIEQVDLFVKSFKDDFIKQLKLWSSGEIANFYLDNKLYLKAKKIFQLMADAHPKSAMPINRLGHVYKGLKDRAKAKDYFERSIKLAKASGSGRLLDYQKDLAGLQK